jgi:hypothetical protein
MTDIADFGGIEVPDEPASELQIHDVIVCATGDDNVSLEEFRANPPVGMTPRRLFENAVPEVDLGNGIKLTSFDDSEEIFNACGPAGPNFNPARQFGQRYSFVRERSYAEVEDSLFGFDEDAKIQHALCLSRLIRDNGFSYEFAARVIDGHDGKRTIRPFGAKEGTAIYRLLPDREWLTGDEAQVLAGLLATFHAAMLPRRVQEALWRSEFATHMARIDMMIFAIVSGLEALAKVGYGRSTRQFKRRTPRLAEDLGIDGIDAAICGRMYDARSGWAHGSPVLFGLSDPPAAEEELRVKEEVAVFRDLLRAGIRRAIEDEEFRGIFEDDAEIDARWS